ncbi:MAG: PIN domain protein [Planctomycetota bacterium]
MRKLLIYVDASVIGGCIDPEFSEASRVLWREFQEGRHIMALSPHTLRELHGALKEVRDLLNKIPAMNQVVLADTLEAAELAEAYVARGVVGPGSRADALHVALATTGRVDVLVSWNFKHIVNLGRIRLFNSVNVEKGYGIIEIRTPKEVLEYE